MKRTLISATIVAILLLGSVRLAAQGQCPPLPDCFSDPWTGPVSVVFTMTSPNGPICTFTVSYCYRTACGMYNDMYITGVQISPECFGVFSIDQILDQAMEDIWKADPWEGDDIPTCPEQSTKMWRVFSAGCYASVPPGGCDQGGDPPDFAAPYAPVTMNPCNESAQCFAHYSLCRTLTGEIQETLLSTFPAGQCTGEIAGCPCSHWCPGEQLDPVPFSIQTCSGKRNFAGIGIVLTYTRTSLPLYHSRLTDAFSTSYSSPVSFRRVPDSQHSLGRLGRRLARR